MSSRALSALRSRASPLGVYRVGQSWTEPPNAHHVVSANASETEPARLIAYIIADDGAEHTVYDK
jgi:quercetin dioxygenase-like cupin family protein